MAIKTVTTSRLRMLAGMAAAISLLADVPEPIRMPTKESPAHKELRLDRRERRARERAARKRNRK